MAKQDKNHGYVSKRKHSSSTPSSDYETTSSRSGNNLNNTRISEFLAEA